MKWDRYLASFALNDGETTGAYTREERLAALLNAYNAFTMKTILEHYPRPVPARDARREHQ